MGGYGLERDGLVSPDRGGGLCDPLGVVLRANESPQVVRSRAVSFGGLSPSV